MSAGVAAALWRSSAGTSRRVAGVALTILVLTYAYNYGATVEMQLDHTVAWFSWYLSWPLLLAGLAALVWLVAGRAVREPDVAFTVVLLTVVGLQYLWNPLESTEHIWSMRRFVPVVLPLLMLVVSLGVVAARGSNRLRVSGGGLWRRRAYCCWRSSLGRVWPWLVNRSGAARLHRRRRWRRRFHREPSC